jgi:site-specific recombinase XerC
MYSAKIKLAKRPKVDGTAAIGLRVIINRKVKDIDLHISWPVKYFDKEKGVCKARTRKKDQECLDTNMIIGKAQAKANEIFMQYRLSGRNLTLELFLRDYHTEFNKQCFISFYEHRMLERLKNREIVEESKKQHNNTLNKLKDFTKGTLLFHQLDHKFASSFDSYLKKDKLQQNTRWGHHKDVKTYLNQARRSHVKFEDPYEYFSVSPVDGKWAALSWEERETLYAHYLKTKVGTSDRRILQKFLFGCYSGLRLSDQKRLKEELIEGGELRFNPWKNRRYSQLLEIPLLNRALELVKDSLEENNCESVFWNYTDQFSNRKLKDIAKALEIKKNLHHHVGRITFATLFTEAGGSVEELQWYLGHLKISTTMKYVKVNKERLQKRISQMNEK